MLKVGDRFIEFKLNDQEGNELDTKSIQDEYTVLYFYPKDLTPGCTIEACEFRDENKEFKNLNAKVIGIGRGDEKTKKKFSEKHELNFPILNDIENKIADKYGVLREKSMFGKKYMGVDRVTYLFKRKELIQIWEKVKPEGHAEEVIKFIKENS